MRCRKRARFRGLEGVLLLPLMLSGGSLDLHLPSHPASVGVDPVPVFAGARHAADAVHLEATAGVVLHDCLACLRPKPATDLTSPPPGGSPPGDLDRRPGPGVAVARAGLDLLPGSRAPPGA